VRVAGSVVSAAECSNVAADMRERYKELVNQRYGSEMPFSRRRGGL